MKQNTKQYISPTSKQQF